MHEIIILGSTGSIGIQALEIVEANPSLFKVIALSAGGAQTDLLIAQAKKFGVKVVATAANGAALRDALPGVQIIDGPNASAEVAAISCDVVLNAITGSIGLNPTLAALDADNRVALANKESLVAGGDLVTSRAKPNQLLPVDSEHSAIFQCLVGEWQNPIEKIFLTASGGPFRGKTIDQLEKVTVADALKHPNWTMGAKITIDSATLMNKGLEVIEAKWLFGLRNEQIDVVIHPQSILHSFVQFVDGSLKAQMGLPDMKLPIQYALAYAERIQNDFPRFNFAQFPHLSFEQADTKTFSCLQLAFDALKKGGNAPCILNAANEVAVKNFLQQKISFTDIADMVQYALALINHNPNPTMDDLIAIDKLTRVKCEEWVIE